MTKKQSIKTKKMFSLQGYLTRKATKKVEKLTSRKAKREAKMHKPT
jgi:hypothetical protein